ncbi:hypothetical protein SAU060112_10322 [Staphylococcus aureus]|nr:hypothetical protein SAU060112_10322 [Staphylococcus aureus]
MIISFFNTFNIKISYSYKLALFDPFADIRVIEKSHKLLKVNILK